MRRQLWGAASRRATHSDTASRHRLIRVWTELGLEGSAIRWLWVTGLTSQGQGHRSRSFAATHWVRTERVESTFMIVMVFSTPTLEPTWLKGAVNRSSGKYHLSVRGRWKSSRHYWTGRSAVWSARASNRCRWTRSDKRGCTVATTRRRGARDSSRSHANASSRFTSLQPGTLGVVYSIPGRHSHPCCTAGARALLPVGHKNDPTRPRSRFRPAASRSTEGRLYRLAPRSVFEVFTRVQVCLCVAPCRELAENTTYRSAFAPSFWSVSADV